jgi:hypothetical protein
MGHSGNVSFPDVLFIDYFTLLFYSLDRLIPSQNIRLPWMNLQVAVLKHLLGWGENRPSQAARSGPFFRCLDYIRQVQARCDFKMV